MQFELDPRAAANDGTSRFRDIYAAVASVRNLLATSDSTFVLGECIPCEQGPGGAPHPGGLALNDDASYRQGLGGGGGGTDAETRARGIDAAECHDGHEGGGGVGT